MGVMVDGDPISMWSDERLRESLDRIVSTLGLSREVLIIAEVAQRAFQRSRIGETNAKQDV